MPTGTQKITVYVLEVYELQGQLEVKEKKNEELYNSSTWTVLVMGNLPTLMVGDFQMDPSGTSRQHMTVKTQHFLFDVAEHFTQGIQETTYCDGRQEPGLDYVFASTAAMRAVRRFDMLQGQVVSDTYTATQMREAPKKELEKDFEKKWVGKGQHLVERCD